MENLRNKTLESRLTKLERILLGKGDSLIKDTSTFTSNILRMSDIMRDTVELWYEGLVLSPADAADVKTDLSDIIAMSKKILRELM